MKKLLISILNILLLALCIFAIWKGIKVGPIQVFSLAEIKNESEQLDSYIDNATVLASTTYPNTLGNLQTDVKKLEQEKKNYEDLITISTSEQVEIASQFQKYELEYLWTTIGNHARNEGVVIKIELVNGSIDKNYNLHFTVTGSYIGITDFITAIENDSSLGFKIEEFRMVPNSSTSELQATFTCKDITIKEVLGGSATVQKDADTQNNTTSTNGQTNTTNTNSTNTNSTTNSTTNTSNTSNTNSASNTNAVNTTINTNIVTQTNTTR